MFMDVADHFDFVGITMEYEYTCLKINNTRSRFPHPASVPPFVKIANDVAFVNVLAVDIG
jgi:hypothetical protein